MFKYRHIIPLEHSSSFLKETNVTRVAVRFRCGDGHKVRHPWGCRRRLANGEEAYACHRVTSVDNALPIDRDTLYVLGSVTKTFTATSLMRLVAEGKVELDAPVRRYIPELGSPTSRPLPR